MPTPKVAVLRPDDTRIDEAICYLQSLDVIPIADPMLTICSTGKRPRKAEYCIFTSTTGVELAVEHGWEPAGTTVCAVGRQTATALRGCGYSADVIPSTFTSTGLVEELADEVEGKTVEIARSAHGSDVLIQGLKEAGAAVHETHLYCLEHPSTAGRSVSLAIEGELDGILFSSPKTVDHFFEIATERDAVGPLQRELAETVIGAIGAPTARTVRKNGGSVDVVPDQADFNQLADTTVNRIRERQQ
ncbi:uroporphyrinogen-III synthase [Halegenticoccus tardaugens]|uniref:uroporphyrinogen-III synthase n=1 Tax=Halegenticoccus tardaugens TaxID=2071624 RepID=UPI00100ACD37|nr:uroporphyrinogen-III synthase [Halegenticoccus tardaugens]